MLTTSIFGLSGCGYTGLPLSQQYRIVTNKESVLSVNIKLNKPNVSDSKSKNLESESGEGFLRSPEEKDIDSVMAPEIDFSNI
mmetsp:Transcript_40172/g.61345  ORF Transcript_40172/g.61345 Transcript_40172/m.61345 type:complete len:83 (+) Transcript_40172:313-561(+)